MSERRLRDARDLGLALSGDEPRRETVKRPTKTLVCRQCKTRVETEADYDKCPTCGASGSELLQETRVRDNG